MITVLDEEYPTNLRQVYNWSPFLFVRGQLSERDNRAIAIVGTRRASEAGITQARRWPFFVRRRVTTASQ